MYNDEIVRRTVLYVAGELARDPWNYGQKNLLNFAFLEAALRKRTGLPINIREVLATRGRVGVLDLWDAAPSQARVCGAVVRRIDAAKDGSDA